MVRLGEGKGVADGHGADGQLGSGLPVRLGEVFGCSSKYPGQRVILGPETAMRA